MKGSSGDQEDREIETMAGCLMLLPKVGKNQQERPKDGVGRVYKCKTCSRQFNSFQALGGHRASHKTPAVDLGGLGDDNGMLPNFKTKTHECSICGLKFAIGQALGGHMRKHRGELMNEGSSEGSVTDGSVRHEAPEAAAAKNSKKQRVFPLGLDLNLMPLENELELTLTTGPTVTTV